MKSYLLMSVCLLSACGWFGAKRHPAPDPAEIIVSGAPADSVVFIDGAQVEASAGDSRRRVIVVAAGDHTVEIHVADRIVYREDTYVGTSEHRVVLVLSGSDR